MSANWEYEFVEYYENSNIYMELWLEGYVLDSLIYLQSEIESVIYYLASRERELTKYEKSIHIYINLWLEVSDLISLIFRKVVKSNWWSISTSGRMELSHKYETLRENEIKSVIAYFIDGIHENSI